MDESPPTAGCCCESGQACVFSKALLVRDSSCQLGRRVHFAEREMLECSSAAARLDCEHLAVLLREQARSALHLPPPGRPLMHAQALRLQCAGLAALRSSLGVAGKDVHGAVSAAVERHGTLTALPWDAIVSALVSWRPTRRI